MKNIGLLLYISSLYCKEDNNIKKTSEEDKKIEVNQNKLEEEDKLEELEVIEKKKEKKKIKKEIEDNSPVVRFTLYDTEYCLEYKEFMTIASNLSNIYFKCEYEDLSDVQKKNVNHASIYYFINQNYIEQELKENNKSFKDDHIYKGILEKQLLKIEEDFQRKTKLLEEEKQKKILESENESMRQMYFAIKNKTISVSKQDIINLKNQKISNVMRVNNKYYILIFDSTAPVKYKLFDYKQSITDKIIQESLNIKCKEIEASSKKNTKFL